MDVTVVMNVYNQRRDWFLEALDSLVAQSCNPEIIVSGVKGDPTEEWLRIFPGVKWVESHYPDCKVQINNGIKFALGKYIVLAGSDDWFFPKSIETMLKIANEKDAIIVYPGLYHCDEKLNVILEWRPPKEFSLNKLKQSCLMTDSSLVSKSALWEFGLFDVTWRKFAIWDMWFKIANKYPNRIFPSNHILCKYRRHPNSLSSQSFRGRNLDGTGEDLRQAFYKKYSITELAESSKVNGKIVVDYKESSKILLDKGLPITYNVLH